MRTTQNSHENTFVYFADKQRIENEIKSKNQRETTIEALEEQLCRYKIKVFERLTMNEIINPQCIRVFFPLFCSSFSMDLQRKVQNAETIYGECEKRLYGTLNGIENLFRYVAIQRIT